MLLKELHFGIEIETVGLHRQALAEAIRGVVHGRIVPAGGDVHVYDRRGRIWKVVRDASLNGADRSGEIVSPILSYDDIDVLQQIVRAVYDAGGRADESTGIHIHIDGARFDARSVTNLVKIVHKQERLIEHALGIQPARLARYTRSIDSEFVTRLEQRRPKTLADVSKAWYSGQDAVPTRYHQSRYRGLNLNSLFFRGTIEMRYFEGTLHAGKVKSYVQFVLALAARAISSKTASSKRRGLDVATAKYDFRVFLLSLGLIGEEFKTARFHLTQGLGGSAAWKGGRRDRRPPTGAINEEEHEHAQAA